MSETFTPLVATPVSSGGTATLPLTVLPQAQARAVFEPLGERGKPVDSVKGCRPPSVTLQRQGEVVSSIRIECGCGQVIELSCAY